MDIRKQKTGCLQTFILVICFLLRLILTHTGVITVFIWNHFCLGVSAATYDIFPIPKPNSFLCASALWVAVSSSIYYNIAFSPEPDSCTKCRVICIEDGDIHTNSILFFRQKTNIILFGYKRRHAILSVNNEAQVKLVKKFKYLEALIDEKYNTEYKSLKLLLMYRMEYDEVEVQSQ